MDILRPQVYEKGLPRPFRNGDGYLANARVSKNAEAGAQNITIAQILGGVAYFSGAAGAVDYTLPTAAAILAALPSMDIGDSFHFKLVNVAAQTATVLTNTGITLEGLVTANASSREFIIQKTSATTVTVTGI